MAAPHGPLTPAAGTIDASEFAALSDRALGDTLERLTATGSPALTDGEQTKPSFATYLPVAGHRQSRAGRCDDSVRRRPHATVSTTDRRPVPVRDVRRVLSGQGARCGECAGEAAGDRAVRAEPAVPGGRCSGYPRRRGVRAARLHRGAAVAQAGPVEGTAAEFRRAEQRRAEQHCSGPVLRRGARAARGAAGPVRAARRHVLRAARERAGPAARAGDHPRPPQAGPAGVRRRRRPDRPARRDGGGGARPRARGGGRAGRRRARHLRRLRLRAVRGRRVHVA